MNKYKILICVAVFAIAAFLLYFVIPDKAAGFQDYSTIILDENKEILRVFLNKSEQWCFPPDPEMEIPSKLETAVLQYEDRYFYYHPGVNPFALLRALFLNIKHRIIISGGSTLTMQVARLTDPKSRTIPNKIYEILQAFKLELKYSKKDILKLYLDHAPYGRNIIGIQAASRKYYYKEPQNLTWSEAATLAVLPNSPGLISPGKNQQRLINKRNRLLGKLFKKKIIDEETLELSLLEPVPNTVHTFPISAPHISQYLKSKNRENIIKTTLNCGKQQQLEQILEQHSDFLQLQGISNICALVVETKTGKIRAYAGSQNYWDKKTNGQVNGVQAPRSTGSILKPLLYALSMDAGILIPQTLMKDVPTYFGSFSPENANEKYDGLVTAEDALVRSLNIPAVRLLNTYGVQEFYHFLKIAGVSTLFRDSEDYGLTLIIGGSEATLYDLVMLYKGLGNYGKFTPLFVEDDKEKMGHYFNLVSPGACFLTLEIMKEVKRPGIEYYWHQYHDQKPLAWKTGTSFGQRDAWAIGVNPQWTIGVWVGNFTGEGNSAISGASCAGPILFDIFNSLPKDTELTWFKMPIQEMDVITICKDTGFLAGPNCIHKENVLTPFQMKPLRLCPFCKNIFVDKEEKYRVCSLCWEAGNYKAKSVKIYPPNVSQYLRERGQNIDQMPLHNPGCPGEMTSNTIEILYPTNKARLWIPREIGGELQKITLRAAHRNSGSFVFWYLDDLYIGDTIDKHFKAVLVNNGNHYLKVIDENGNTDEVAFSVQTRE